MIRTIIIEDDPMVAQINCQYLQPLGDFQIDGIFNSGAAAQEYLKENEADLAIVDIYMPGMNGIELLRWKQNWESPLAPPKSLRCWKPQQALKTPMKWPAHLPA